MRFFQDRLKKKWAKQGGLTMIELLVVIAILAGLIILMMWFLRNQPHKARDAKRKADLRQYAVAFEDYFNDKERYPETGALENCNGSDLQPYLQRVLCDPGAGNLPYDYITDTQGTWFAICADLENDADPDIEELGCSDGCGSGLAYDYCTTVGVTISDIGGVIIEGGGDGGGNGMYEGQFACDVSGVCNSYADPEAAGCPRSWTENDCQGYCTLPVGESLPPQGDGVPNPAFACD